MGNTTTNIIHASTLGLVPKKAIDKTLGFGKKSMGQAIADAPMPLPQPPSPDAAAAKAEDVVRKKKASLSKSIYTSPLGIAGEADVARKTLLGQ